MNASANALCVYQKALHVNHHVGREKNSHLQILRVNFVILNAHHLLLRFLASCASTVASVFFHRRRVPFLDETHGYVTKGGRHVITTRH